MSPLLCTPLDSADMHCEQPCMQSTINLNAVFQAAKMFIPMMFTEKRRVSLITCKPHSNITAQTALKKPDQTLLGNHKDRLIGVFGVVESRSPPPETNANSLDVYTPHTSTCRKQTHDLQVPLSWCSITYSFNWGRKHSQEWGGEAQVTADSATHHCP